MDNRTETFSSRIPASRLGSKFADCHSNIVDFSVLWSPERTAVEAVPASFFSTFVTLGQAREDGILSSILPLS
jgi:hypothetical protein